MDPVDYLLGLERLGIKFGLENIRTICSRLGNPQDGYRSVIVAGTNGKGSVTAMVDAALGAGGLRAARYTSPHLVRLEERFAIGGRPVAAGDFRDAVAFVQASVEELRAEGVLSTEPTFFEVTTAVGFELFRRARVEVVVLEVGLGGRFDATNVANPLAGAVTTIDLDHERFLGYTIPQIAFEKAGIIKPGMTVVVGETKPEAVDVIAGACRDRGARLVPAREGVSSRVVMREGYPLVDLETPRRRYGPVTVGLRGRHQADNAIVAVRLLEELEEAGLKVPAEAIVAGVGAARWRGRLDLVEAEGGRRVLFDAAHNPAGARVLGEYLREFHPQGLPIVFGVMRDKDAAGMLAALLPHATDLIVTQPPNPRAASPAFLVHLARQLGRSDRVEIDPVPASALDRAWRRSSTVAVAGSIFLVGDLLPRVDPTLAQ
jgi:dihydrofolate synthase / folylpolyglutamate synthase